MATIAVQTSSWSLPVGAVAALCCGTKIKAAGFQDRNRPLSWVGDTGIEPVTSSV